MSDTQDTATVTTTAADVPATAAVPTSEAATEQPTGEGQGGAEQPAAAEAPAEGDTPEGEAAEPQGAPEAYEAFTLPEGFELAGERAQVAEQYFRENNMSQAAAQNAIDLFVKLNAENLAGLEAQRVQRIEEWGKQTRDQFGPQFEQVNSDARIAVKAVKSDALMEAFDTEGWGNHPELVRAFAHFGKLLRDDAPRGMAGDSPSRGQPASIADRMYPDMRK